MLKLKSIKEERLWRKFLLAYILMSVVPVLILLYVIHFIIGTQNNDADTTIQWLIFWIVCSSLVGFWLVKGMLRSFMTVVKTVRNVAEGDLSARIDNAEELEINELAQSFGRITHQLEDNIRDLQKSKKLIQEVLSKVGQAVASFQNIDKFLELIVISTVEALRAENGQLMLIDSGGKELTTKFSFGQVKISPDRIKLGEGIMGRVAQQGKPFLTSALTTEYKGMQAICVPLSYGNKIMGVFALTRKNGRTDFSEDDRVLLSDLASQISIAMENYRLSADAEQTYVETITALAMAVEARDQYTRGHTKRVGEYCTKLARAFNLEEKTVKLLNDASNLHDIGKIGIPDHILRKPMPLTLEEMKLVYEHPIIGENILRPIRSLSELCDLVRHHHERLDGSGYPDGIGVDKISLPLHIMIVADVFDAMTTDRPYRKAVSLEESKQELRKFAGIRYDAKVVEKFLQIL